MVKGYCFYKDFAALPLFFYFHYSGSQGLTLSQTLTVNFVDEWIEGNKKGTAHQPSIACPDSSGGFAKNCCGYYYDTTYLNPYRVVLIL